MSREDNNINTDPKKCSYCGRYPNRPVAIDALITKDNKILLIKRGSDPYKDYWAIPGGHIDYNESAEDAVVREVKEEVGLKVTKMKFVGLYSSPKRSPIQTIALVFKVTTRGTPKPGDDAADCRYFPIAELPQNLGFDHQKIISDHVKKR